MFMLIHLRGDLVRHGRHELCIAVTELESLYSPSKVNAEEFALMTLVTELEV